MKLSKKYIEERIVETEEAILGLQQAVEVNRLLLKTYKQELKA